MYSHCCATIINIRLQNVFITPNWNSIKQELPISPSSLPLVTTILPSVSINFPLLGTSYKLEHIFVLLCLVYFTKHDVFKVHHVIAYVRISFLLRQANIPSYEYTKFPLSSHLSMDICAICAFWLFPIMLLWTKLCKSSVWVLVVLKVEFLNHGTSMSSVLRNHSTIFNSVCTILNFYQQCT